MSAPKPPFHSVSEELLYNILLKLPEMGSLTENDINTVAKLNALVLDGDLATLADLGAAINNLKGNVPEVANSLEKLYNIIQGLTYLSTEDIDTIAELNAILTDADVVKNTELVSAIDELKGNVPANADTLEKLFTLLSPVLSAWVQGGNAATGEKPIGTTNNFALPFITNNIERGRFDTSGNFLVGHATNGLGRFHLRTGDTINSNFACYIDDPTLNVLFGVTNAGRFVFNKQGENLLINGGRSLLTGARNIAMTLGSRESLLGSGSDSVIFGFNAFSTIGAQPQFAGGTRIVVIGSEAVAAGNAGSNISDAVVIGYRACLLPGEFGGTRSVYIGSRVCEYEQSGYDHVAIGYDSQVANSNTFVTLIGSGTKAYNSLGTITAAGGAQNFMTAIGAGAVVRTSNTVKIGRNGDSLVVGSESRGEALNGSVGAIEATQGVLNFGLGVKGRSYLLGDVDQSSGDFRISLGDNANASIKNSFRVNTYVYGLGGYDFALSAANIDATLEIIDYQFGGTKPEMVRISPGGYANTGIMIRPNDIYNTTYGYRYELLGTNQGQQSRYVSAFHARVNFPLNDNFPLTNQVQMFAAVGEVRNHLIDGFFADVRSSDATGQAYAFHSVGSRILFDGAGMSFQKPIVAITSDVSAHAGATNLLLNGGNVSSAALYVISYGTERAGVIISPGRQFAHGLFIGPQQALGTHNYDGYLLCLQYSSSGNNIQGSTAKPMLYIRKHAAVLNGHDHQGAFIRMEENIGSTGAFIEAYKHDVPSNSFKLKFSVDKEGVVSIAQLVADPGNVPQVGRLYFIGDSLKYVAPSGAIMTVKT